MSKKLRNLALLGGLGAAAAMAMRGKGKDEESKDTTGDASAGLAKDRLSDFRGKSGEADRDIGPAIKRAAAKPAAPTAKPAAPAAPAAKPAAKPAAPVATTRQDKSIDRYNSIMANPAGDEDTKPRVIGSYGDAARSARTLGDFSPIGKNRVERRGYKSGGKVSSASSRADGCATKGKTRGKMI